MPSKQALKQSIENRLAKYEEIKAELEARVAEVEAKESK